MGYLALKFLHIVGFVLIGGGLVGVFLAGLSGLLLTLGLAVGFFQLPWLTGMWVLFLVIVSLGALRPPT